MPMSCCQDGLLAVAEGGVNEWRSGAPPAITVYEAAGAANPAVLAAQIPPFLVAFLGMSLLRSTGDAVFAASAAQEEATTTADTSKRGSGGGRGTDAAGAEEAAWWVSCAI